MSAARCIVICLVLGSGLTLFVVTSRDDKRYMGKKELIYTFVGSHSFMFGSNRVTFSSFDPPIEHINQLKNETPEAKKRCHSRRSSEENETTSRGGKEQD